MLKRRELAERKFSLSRLSFQRALRARSSRTIPAGQFTSIIPCESIRRIYANGVWAKGTQPGLIALPLGFGLELEIEGDCGADEVLQGGGVNVFAFVDVDGAPDIAFEAGVEQA